ncbi:MAG: hypothetical protein OEN20_12915 [Gammaproteobacteria bacterium]|nr:hypothetical protein [Gammaproteobacteria bacterium]
MAAPMDRAVAALLNRPAVAPDPEPLLDALIMLLRAQTGKGQSTVCDRHANPE